MFPLHPDHRAVIASDRRRRLEQDAQNWRVVRDAPAGAEPRRRLAGDQLVVRDGAPSAQRRGLLPLRRVLRLAALPLRSRRAGRTRGTALSNRTSPNQGEQPCLPPQPCQPSLTSR
jgi:hypothetical protein